MRRVSLPLHLIKLKEMSVRLELKRYVVHVNLILREIAVLGENACTLPWPPRGLTLWHAIETFTTKQLVSKNATCVNHSMLEYKIEAP